MGSEPILLEDLLHLLGEEKDRIKVRFNMDHDGERAIDVWRSNHATLNRDWHLWRTAKRPYFEGDIAISLAQVNSTKDLWLLTAVMRITKDLDIKGGVSYEVEDLSEYSKYCGRVLIAYKKEYQAQVRHYEGIYKDLIVAQVLSDEYEDDPFPGYENVCIDFPTLERIVSPTGGKNSWTEALEHQKAIYLITNKDNGRLYVGSAYNDNGMLLGRWRDYAVSGHGNDVKLIKLLEEKGEGIEYARRYFQFSILEVFGSCISDPEIIHREHWWMNKLDTKTHGYNS